MQTKVQTCLNVKQGVRGGGGGGGRQAVFALEQIKPPLISNKGEGGGGGGSIVQLHGVHTTDRMHNNIQGDAMVMRSNSHNKTSNSKWF